jgi:hypothetical protein
MQAIGDLFRAFGPPQKNVTVLADEIGEKRDTVYRWLRAKRIPETSWQSVIEAAKRHDIAIDASLLFQLNKPAKKRGRPVKKISARRGRQ